jgi:hypothetical protein
MATLLHFGALPKTPPESTTMLVGNYTSPVLLSELYLPMASHITFNKMSFPTIIYKYNSR